MDLKGKFRIRSIKGNYCFDSIVHLGSTMLFFDFQKTKDAVVGQIPTIIDRHLEPLCLGCKTIWSDSEMLYSALTVRQLASKAGVVLECIAPYRQEDHQESWISTGMRLLFMKIWKYINMKSSLECNADDLIYLKIPEIYEDNPSTKPEMRRSTRTRDMKCNKFVKDIIA